MSSGEWIMDNLDPLNFSTEEDYYEYHNTPDLTRAAPMAHKGGKVPKAEGEQIK